MSAIADIIVAILYILNLALILRIVLSWFPGINWYTGFFAMLDKITEPMLAPFRKIIPPIGGMLDISPIVPLFLLNALIAFFEQFTSGGFY